MPQFVHLRLHTEFSLVDGIVRIKPLMGKIAELGMPAVAMTDQSNLFGMVKFYKSAQGAGIKPILGADLWIANPDDEADPSRIVCLCQDQLGYLNLTRIISRSFQEGQRLDRAIVEEAWFDGQTEGLIVLSGAREGDVGRAILAGKMDRAQSLAQKWADRFPGRFYLELQRTGRVGENDWVHGAVELAANLDLPVVATNEVCFISGDDFEAHEARVCIHDGYTLDDPKRPHRYSEQQHLRTADEMVELFKDIPAAIENTVEIAKRCNLDITLGKNYLPDFPIPRGLTPDEFLREQSAKGLEERLPVLIDANDPDFASKQQVYWDRLQIELDVICQMGFPGYFLIVADFIQWAKDNDVPVGPGRGSGAGSLVAYVLKITDLDPLQYDLLFERFLNPERVSMPDFDIDFCMEGRDRVIQYVAEKYGREKVSQIATHGTMAAKAVIRDVGRVLGHPYGFVDRIAKLIPFEIGITLNKALDQEPELKDKYDNDEEVRYLLDLGMKLEGVARNVGKHAGGVVIAPSQLTDFSPLYCEPDGRSVVTQYDKDDVEAVGLVKFDFLGLRTLTIIDWAVKAINQIPSRAEEQPVDIARIPLEDVPTFRLLKDCQTTAVFQLESRGMKDLIRRLQPDCFEDIIALVALFRPGPLQSGMVDDFIDRKHGRAKVNYPHPDLEPILKPTYGVILYQEQVMQIAQVLAGYTLGGADMLRRAMGKKKPEEMEKQRVLFMEGAEKRGVDMAQAGSIFDLMEKFAGYGFNKSHSAAYALLSYQTAWLKSHFPAPMMAAVLSSDMDNTDKVVIFIEECRDMKLQVLSPDINHSFYMFRAMSEKTVRYGLGAVKGVGQAAIENIIEERQNNGEYTDLYDFCRRIDLKKANRRVLEALIRAGALDTIAPNRATLMAHLNDALAQAEQSLKNASAGQNDLFGFEPAPVEQDNVVKEGDVYASNVLQEWEGREKLRLEKETLGLYLTGHPIDQFEAEIRKITQKRIIDVISNVVKDARPGRGRGGTDVTLAGLVVGMRTRITQSGGKMAFMMLDDRSARVEVAVFTKTFEEFREIILMDQILIVQGSLSYDEYSDGMRVRAERMYTIEQARSVYAKRLLVSLDQSASDPSNLQKLQAVLSPFRAGPCPVHVEYQRADARVVMSLGDSWQVTPTDELITQLRQISPNSLVKVDYA